MPGAMSLADLPCEIIRMIARTIYDPLKITQKDRLSESYALHSKLTLPRQPGAYSLL